MGRPTKLTPEIQERICQAIRTGNTRKDAAAYAGVSERAMAYWQARGRRRKKGRYFQFLQALQKADADAICRNVAVIQKATQGGTVVSRKTITRKDGSVEVSETFSEPQWTAAAWWLERRRPDDYGKRERHEHTGADGGEIIIKRLGPGQSMEDL